MKYYPIPTEDLKIDTILNFNIYIQQNDRFVLFREQHHTFTEKVLSRLIENRINKVFVSEDGLQEFNQYNSSLQNNNHSDLSKECFAGPIFDKPENVEKYYTSFFDYYPVETKTLIPGTEVNFNIYKKKEIDVELYFGPESQKSEQDIVPEDVAETHLPLVIRKEDIDLYREYLHYLTQEYSKYETTPQELRCSIIRENSKLVVKEVLEDPRCGENIHKSGDVVGTLVETVLDNKDSFYK